MSHFATPLIVVNLGCEMLYVIDQRLKTQNIPVDKSVKVLTDLVTVLLHPKLMEEIFLPQPVPAHNVIKQLLLDIAVSSIMRLDDYSMNRLWDLITMIFKWQISIARKQNAFDITRRHLKSVAMLVPDICSKQAIESTIIKFETLAKNISEDDYKSLFGTLVLWFSEYRTKISVLLRLGLQLKDGLFRTPSAIHPKLLKNLGDNIYTYDTKMKSIDDYDVQSSDGIEINCLLGLIKQSSSKESLNFIENITLNGIRKMESTGAIIEDIQISRKEKGDLNFIANIPKTTKEDLLQMLDGDILKEIN
ncbi:protein OSCP1 [Leptidea sinapis]|uniref:protein OSCP1 n=1 Tax=Leptidea sinapis TaxID=189913 RepID=UPI00212336F2|nr:protein OSCP1 [Leptidea sinapis]